MGVFVKLLNRDETSIRLQNLERLLKKIDTNHFALGEYNYKYYCIYLNDDDQEINKRYKMNISTLRGFILQIVYFDKIFEVASYLENVKLKIEKDIWP